jgi:hypothetical protein
MVPWKELFRVALNIEECSTTEWCRPKVGENLKRTIGFVECEFSSVIHD